MKLLFKQRLFSWFDSYDIYDEAGDPVYIVRGQLAWGHCLRIFDAAGHELGIVKERILAFFPGLKSMKAADISAVSEKS